MVGFAPLKGGGSAFRNLPSQVTSEKGAATRVCPYPQGSTVTRETVAVPIGGLPLPVGVDPCVDPQMQEHM